MNRRAADLRRSNLYCLNDAGPCARIEHRVDSQCQTHDKSGDNSQSHDSSRIKYFPFISCGPLQVGDPLARLCVRYRRTPRSPAECRSAPNERGRRINRPPPRRHAGRPCGRPSDVTPLFPHSARPDGLHRNIDYIGLKVSCSSRHRSIDSILKRQSLPTLNAGNLPRLSCR
jgi:hypothetical protein